MDVSADNMDDPMEQKMEGEDEGHQVVFNNEKEATCVDAKEDLSIASGDIPSVTEEEPRGTYLNTGDAVENVCLQEAESTVTDEENDLTVDDGDVAAADEGINRAESGVTEEECDVTDEESGLTVEEGEETEARHEPMQESDDSCDSCDSFAWNSQTCQAREAGAHEVEDWRLEEEEEDVGEEARQQLASWLEDVEKKLDFLYNYEPPEPSSCTTEGIGLRRSAKLRVEMAIQFFGKSRSRPRYSS
jgi:hypothetical protein